MNNDLVEYQMKVHVFGNTTSPAIATYALRKTVEASDENVKNFVMRYFMWMMVCCQPKQFKRQ